MKEKLIQAITHLICVNAEKVGRIHGDVRKISSHVSRCPGSFHIVNHSIIIKPDEYASCLRVYIMHDSNLMILLKGIVLVDAYLIDPKIHRLATGFGFLAAAESQAERVQVSSNVEVAIIDVDRKHRHGLAPSVRERDIFWSGAVFVHLKGTRDTIGCAFVKRPETEQTNLLQLKTQRLVRVALNQPAGWGRLSSWIHLPIFWSFWLWGQPRFRRRLCDLALHSGRQFLRGIEKGE